MRRAVISVAVAAVVGVSLPMTLGVPQAAADDSYHIEKYLTPDDGDAGGISSTVFAEADDESHLGGLGFFWAKGEKLYVSAPDRLAEAYKACATINAWDDGTSLTETRCERIYSSDPTVYDFDWPEGLNTDLTLKVYDLDGDDVIASGTISGGRT